jgi:hypothetical protein
MDYFVKRSEQRYGPYSLTDLQRYVQSGNIAADDLTQSEGMNEWVPVSQVLGTIPVATLTPPGTATLATPAMPQLVELPPNLHWIILLILEAVTRNLFNLVWALVQANWARKLIDDNKPMVLVAMYPAGIIAGILAMMNRSTRPLGGLFIIAGVIVYLVGIFSIRSAMEEYYNSKENIGLTLSPVMTFFFSTVYIQYHINRLARWKKTGVLS